MGASGSKDGGPLAELSSSWVLKYAETAFKYASGSSLAVIKRPDGSKVLAVAYQAAEAAYEGDRAQHLRFALSSDGGVTWGESTCVMWGAAPLWNPILHYDAATGRLFLFYCESRKSLSPGGDIKYVFSSDQGSTWSPPVVIYSHEAEDEVPKVCGARVLVAKDGTWYLPVHREPAESWHTFSGTTFHPLSETPEQQLPAPAGSPAQSMTTAACVLASKDRGLTWEVRGEIEDAKTWLVNPTLEEGTKGQLVMMFRTSTGKTYLSSSSDKGVTWSRPAATYLPNPNSPFASVTIDGQVLCVFNNSQTLRAPLALALSVNDCKTWEPLAIIEEDPKGNFSSPSIVEWSDDTVKVAYTVWGQGLKLASIKLATVDTQ